MSFESEISAAEKLVKEKEPRIEDTIDTGYNLDVMSKRIEAVMKPIKEIVRKTAIAEDNAKELNGTEGKACLTYPETKSIPAAKLFAKMVDEGFITIKENPKGGYIVKADDFFNLVKVSVEATEKLLGTASVGKITTKTPGTPSVKFKEI